MLVGASMAFFATLIACNNIIGLTDFTKGECPNARCQDTEGGPAEAGPDADAGRDAPFDVKGADPVTWAAWKMPNYDAGPDVFLPNPPKLTTDGTVVKDEVTGLSWRNAVLPTDSNNVAAAKKQCEGLTPGSWRLPKRIEVVTLLDFGQAGNKIDPAMFPGVANSQVWTGSDVQPVSTTGPRKYWVINFATGEVGHGEEGNNYKVLCVGAK